MAPLSLLMLLSSAAQGATWAVGPTQALTTIGDALAVAGPADTIEIDPGTYVEDVVITVDDLHLHGLGGVTLAAAGALDVVVVAAGGVVLEGLTVDGDRVARGVRVDDGSSASLVDCRIVDGDRAEGAGLWVGNGSVVSVDATAFEGNTASDDGGAIFASTSSSLQVLRSTFLTNSGDLGGAIACMNGPATCDIVDSHFESNDAARFGGGVRMESVAGQISGSVFCNNVSENGGAFSGSASDFTIANTIFVDNVATEQGGAVRIYDASPPRLSNNHYVGNTASVDGGAVYTNASDWPSVNELYAFNGGAGHTARAFSSSMTFDYGLFYGNTSASGDHDGVAGTGVIVGQDPLLVDYQPGACDPTGLLVSAGSPAIDAGAPSAAYDDVDGSRSDIGFAGGPDGQVPGDTDGDGVPAPEDCDDTDPFVYPGAPETVADGIDQDCSGGDACYADADADAYGDEAGTIVVSADLDCDDPGEASDTTDCDDALPAVNPAASETCGNGVDDNCNGAIDEQADTDADGFDDCLDACPTEPGGSCDLSPADGCPDDGDGDGVGDCDDACPGAPDGDDADGDGIPDGCDLCVGDDELGDTDGDGVCDAACVDDDGDGWTDCDGDCDDDDEYVFPGRDEVPGDGIDQNCNGADATVTWGSGGLGCATAQPRTHLLLLLAAIAGGAARRRRSRCIQRIARPSAQRVARPVDG